MADFHQTGVITTLHRLGRADLTRLERELYLHAWVRPSALVLPCLYAELRDVALKGIIDSLRGVKYLRQIVVSLSGTESRDDFEEMCAAFEGVRTMNGETVTVLWNSGHRMQELYRRLAREGLDAGGDGKGRSAWMAFGYVLSSNLSRMIAVHDCDIRDYNRERLARLCFPIANPNLSYEFAKGYYSRVTDRLYGRVTRLFMTPLLRAMKSVLGSIPLLEFLDSFRYPLAGECAMTAPGASASPPTGGSRWACWRRSTATARSSGSARWSSWTTTTTSTRTSPSTTRRGACTAWWWTSRPR
jgi:glucosyl-3-phosphoglycerate synthase